MSSAQETEQALFSQPQNLHRPLILTENHLKSTQHTAQFAKLTQELNDLCNQATFKACARCDSHTTNRNEWLISKPIQTNMNRKSASSVDNEVPTLGISVTKCLGAKVAQSQQTLATAVHKQTRFGRVKLSRSYHFRQLLHVCRLCIDNICHQQLMNNETREAQQPTCITIGRYASFNRRTQKKID